VAFFYSKSWAGQPDTAKGIGSEWSTVGGSSSGLRQVGGEVGMLDDGTTLTRLANPATTGNEAYAEVKITAFNVSTVELYVGFANMAIGTDTAAAGIYVRHTGGRFRLYSKAAGAVSLVAVGATAGNVTRALAVGDVLRLTIHAGSLSYSINGVTIYTFATTVDYSTYAYPALRFKGDATTRFSEVKTGDYGVESAPAPPAGQVNTITGLTSKKLVSKSPNTGVVLSYLGKWSGSSIVSQPMKYVTQFQPPAPLTRPLTMGPDPTMTDPPALPAGYAQLRTVDVSSGAQLAAALLDARAGDLIRLAANTLYTDTKINLFDKVGTAENPIVIIGPRSADVRLGDSETDYGSGYVGWLQRSSYIWTIGFTMRNGPKGFVLDESNHCWVKGMEIWNIEQEALHFRNFSSDNVAEDNTIHTTGLKSPGFGEAMYCGTAVSNWSATTATRPGQPDACDRNVFRRNKVYAFTGEGLDIKEGTTGTLCEFNWFDGTLLNDDNSADTWVDVKGNDAIIRYNFGQTTLHGGYTVYNPAPGWGMRATFRGNLGNAVTRDGAYTPDPFILVKTPDSGTIVYDDNRYVGSPSLTNIAVTPVPA
jgi:hypothetical protein